MKVTLVTETMQGLKKILNTKMSICQTGINYVEIAGCTMILNVNIFSDKKTSYYQTIINK